MKNILHCINNALKANYSMSKNVEYVVRNDAIEIVDENGNVVATVKTDENGKASIKLTYSKADIGKKYKYTLVEVDTDVPGYIYSLLKYEFELEVQLYQCRLS